MIPDLAKHISEGAADIDHWFAGKERNLDIGIFASFDIRNAGYKTVVVDGVAT